MGSLTGGEFEGGWDRRGSGGYCTVAVGMRKEGVGAAVRGGWVMCRGQKKKNERLCTSTFPTPRQQISIRAIDYRTSGASPL